MRKKKIEDFNYFTNILTPSHMCLDSPLISRVQNVKTKFIFLLWLINTYPKKKKKFEATFGTLDGRLKNIWQKNKC